MAIIIMIMVAMVLAALPTVDEHYANASITNLHPRHRISLYLYFSVHLSVLLLLQARRLWRIHLH
jgi:hypothetical protein